MGLAPLIKRQFFQPKRVISLDNFVLQVEFSRLEVFNNPDLFCTFTSIMVMKLGIAFQQ